MATADGLIGLGIPAEAAKRIGFEITSLTATGTTQGAGVAIPATYGNLLVNLTTAGGQTAAVLPANAGIGDEVDINVITATAALIFPPSGGTIANKSANASVSVAIGARFRKASATLWAVTGGAS